MLVIADVRRALWHFRNGGVRGLQRHYHQRRSTASARRAVMSDHDATKSSANTTYSLPPADSDSASSKIPPWSPIEATTRRPTLTVAAVAPPWLTRLLAFEANVNAPSNETGLDDATLLLLATPFVMPLGDVSRIVRQAEANGVATALWDTVGVLSPHSTSSAAVQAAEEIESLVSDVDAAFTTHPSPRQGVAHLPLAAQPALHNPVRTSDSRHDRDVVLVRGGLSAFARDVAPEDLSETTTKELAKLVDGTVDALPRLSTGFDIYGAAPASSAPLHSGSRSAHLHPMVSEEQRETLMRRYAVALDSRPDPAGPLSRDVFEFTASGTAVVTAARSPANQAQLTIDAGQCDSRPAVGFTVRSLSRSAGLRDRITHRAQRRVWREHTYAHRLEEIFVATGTFKEHHEPSGGTSMVAPRTSGRRSVTALVSSIRPGQLHHVLQSIGSQAGVDVQLAYLAHGWEPHEADLRQRAADAGIADVVLLRDDGTAPLGRCLNRLVDAADGDYVAKMDDDDHYGVHYAEDAIHALDYSAAQVVGKQAHYVHVADQDVTALRFAEREHRYTEFVLGPTIVTHGDFARAHPFPEIPIGEDSAFLRRTLEAGGRIYSADRFNFALLRGRLEHTWRGSDMEVLASADVHMGGFAPSHVDV